MNGFDPKHLIIPWCCLCLLGAAPTTQGLAAELEFQLPAGVELSEEQVRTLKANARAELRQRRQESFTAVGNRHSVMATANCIEGYVKDVSIEKSAPDVEIVAERGVVCSADGCQGWQGEARRASEELFNLEIVLQCTQEDWIKIVPAAE